MASDLEATTATDETKYINPKQAKDNYALVTGTDHYTISENSTAPADTVLAH